MTSPAVASLGLTGRLAFTATDYVARGESICVDSPCFYPSPSEIQIMDLRTGRAAPLTSSPLFERASRWSFDGSRLAYSLARGDSTASLYTIRGDGSDNRQIVSNEGGAALKPTWSPDGQRIAFHLESYVTDPTGCRSEIWMVDPDGTNLRKVDEIPSSDYPSSPAWSPDGRYLAFARGCSESRVYILDLATKQIELLGSGSQPAWAPDGKRLAVKSGDWVKVLAVPDGNEISFISRTGRRFAAPSWSPDGGWIAFSSSGSGSSSLDSARLSIWVARPNGEQLNLVIEGSQEYWAPSWGVG